MPNQSPAPIDSDAAPEVTPDQTPEPEVEPGPYGEPPKHPWPKRLWHALTGTKKRLALTIAGLLVIVVAVIALTPLKYTLIGSFIKTNIDIRVTDTGTHQLLPGAVVKLAGASATTDKTGIAHFTNLHPGATTLVVTKPVYKTSTEALTLGFGDQPAREVRLSSNGIKVSFKLTNYVSGGAVKGARVKLGDADAISGEDGSVTASLSAEDNGQTVSAVITADGFNDSAVPVSVKPGLEPIATKLVPAGKVYYLSNRTGRVDLYESNLDGSGAGVILAGTGSEDDSTGILPNVYDQSVIALVSSRAGKRFNGGLQEDLYIFRPATKQLILVDEKVYFTNYRTWLGKTLIYQKYGQSGTSTESTIQAYDPTAGKSTTVVTCTGDHACPQALYSTDKLFLYSLQGAPVGSSSNGLFAVKAGTTTTKSLSADPASSSYRQALGSVVLQYYNYKNEYPDPGSLWQSVDLESAKVSVLKPGPSSTATRTYVESADDKAIVSVDKRDGQSDLYLVGEDGKDTARLTTTGDVSQFVQWYDGKYIVYSAANQLFVVATAGGKPQKITNFYSGNVNTYSGGYNPSY